MSRKGHRIFSGLLCWDDSVIADRIGGYRVHCGSDWRVWIGLAGMDRIGGYRVHCGSDWRVYGALRIGLAGIGCHADRIGGYRVHCGSDWRV
jgi:hypothetical protein